MPQNVFVGRAAREYDAHEAMVSEPAPVAPAVAFLVYTTIQNLLDQAEQVECFRNAAAHLAPGGRFVIKSGIPAIRRLPPGAIAGMRLRERWADWDRAPFTSESATHISVWELPPR